MSKDPKSRSSDSRPIPHRSVCITAFGTPRSVPVVPQRSSRPAAFSPSAQSQRTIRSHALQAPFGWHAELASILGTLAWNAWHQTRRRYTRRRFGGRQPLCGIGVTSSISLIDMPADCRAVMALSRPDPGPFTRTSNSRTPYFDAFSAACCAAHWPANGVLLRLPLKPQVPALAQHKVSPLVSVTVTVVLLNVAFT